MDSGVQRISSVDFFLESSGFQDSKKKSKQENIKWKHGNFQQLTGNIFRDNEHYIQAKERGKPEYPGKTSQNRVEDQETHSIYDVGSRNETRATLMEGECSYHCVNPTL